MQQLMVDRRRDGMEDGSVIGKQNGRNATLSVCIFTRHGYAFLQSRSIPVYSTHAE